MRVIGIDIGTTTICGVLVEADTGVLLDAVTLPNDTAMTEGVEHDKEPVCLREHLQNPQKILDKCRFLVREYLEKNEDIISIGVTGQMHGIVYTDVNGKAVSPLYTWQDRRGEEPLGNSSYAESLQELTGYKMATGYGMATHFYNNRNNLVDERAVSFCTIPDYIAMSLAGRKRPLVHQSMAASMGLYHPQTKEFDLEAARKARMDISKFPDVTDKNACVGMLDFTELGIESKKDIVVSVALGDNQASFLGSVNRECNMLLNVGTGSQISAYSKTFVEGDTIECRPYLESSWILAGSALCGGYAYSLVKKFAEEICSLSGILSRQREAVDFYEILNKTARAVYDKEKREKIQTSLTVDTRFRGTRKDSSITGGIKNLTEETFHIGNVSLGVLRGICEELYSYYTEFPKASIESTVFAGSGNGIRNNRLLQEICCDRFGMAMRIPLYSEEAAYGTALFSLLSAGYYKSYGDVRDLIRYH